MLLICQQHATHLHESLELIQGQLLVIIHVGHGQNPVPELLC